MNARLLLVSAIALVACDPTTNDDPMSESPAGKADYADENATREAEALILEYWNAWQDGDFEAFRNTLADDVEVDLGVGLVLQGAEMVTAVSEAGHPFRDVEMVATSFHETGGTIIYTGVDDVTDQPLRISEVVEVRHGEIVRVTGVLSVGPAPRVSRNVPFDADGFVPFDPSAPEGPQAQFLYGDPTGPAGLLIKTTSDLEATSHVHSQGYHAIVLQGIVRNAPDIDDTPDMGPGSYWVQAGGEAHITKCMSKKEACISLVMFDGPFDILPPE